MSCHKFPRFMRRSFGGSPQLQPLILWDRMIVATVVSIFTEAFELDLVVPAFVALLNEYFLGGSELHIT